MGRPRGFDETTAVAAAAELFGRRSFDGTSVDDLVNQTGVHRGSLYKTFGSKRGVYLAALRHYLDHDLARLAAALAAAANLGDALRRAISAGAPDVDLGFLFLAAGERAAVDEEVAAEVARGLAMLDAAFRPALADDDVLARGLTAVTLGLLIGARVRGDATGRVADALAARLVPAAPTSTSHRGD